MIQSPPATTLPTLKKRAEFLATAKGGRSARRAFVLQAATAARADAVPRMGYTVTKKTGNAVERNRIRRRFREAVRAAAVQARPGVDYVLIGRRAGLSMDFDTLVREIGHCLAKAPVTADPSQDRRRTGRTPSKTPAKNRR
ncbi:ribonuclease P protein component [Stappia sp.]|uniref:ribonuclease P protein component n=1 Tax=Stappia sp. TaxID=1870903 RepID=UPI003D129CF8